MEEEFQEKKKWSLKDWIIAIAVTIVFILLVVVYLKFVSANLENDLIIPGNFTSINNSEPLFIQAEQLSVGIYDYSMILLKRLWWIIIPLLFVIVISFSKKKRKKEFRR